MKKFLIECINCKRHEVVSSFYFEGFRCRCGGGYKPLNETVLPLTSSHDRKKESEKPLLQIELESETSVPKVLYKGEEITGMINVNFEWFTDTHVIGGLTYAIEHAHKESTYPLVNRIERRIKGHATED